MSDISEGESDISDNDNDISDNDSDNNGTWLFINVLYFRSAKHVFRSCSNTPSS